MDTVIQIHRLPGRAEEVFYWVKINQYDKVVKRRSECRLYKLTGGQTGRQTGRQTGSGGYREAAPLKKLNTKINLHRLHPSMSFVVTLIFLSSYFIKFGPIQKYVNRFSAYDISAMIGAF